MDRQNDDISTDKKKALSPAKKQNLAIAFDDPETRRRFFKI